MSLPVSPANVAELLPHLPLPHDYAKQWGLVFGGDLADRLAAVQAEAPSKHCAKPVTLSDGRFLLCGDLLSEVPNGLYGPGFSRLDASRFDEIAVVPWEEALTLLPTEPEPELP